LEDFNDVFACHTTPKSLSYWEEAKMNKQILALIELCKMKNNDSEYVCRVNLYVKRDGIMRFCGL
jgi:hypothetical protein